MQKSLHFAQICNCNENEIDRFIVQMRFPISRLNLKTLSYDFVTRQARLLIDMGPHYTCL